jgi:S1-C subfamily serine protease
MEALLVKRDQQGLEQMVKQVEVPAASTQKEIKDFSSNDPQRERSLMAPPNTRVYASNGSAKKGKNMSRTIILCLFLLSICGRTCTARNNPPTLRELLVVRAQLSVYEVWAVGDVQVTYPNSVTLNRPLLEDVYKIAKTSENRAAFFWSQIGQYPDKYLEASQEPVNKTINDDTYASGTAFAISWEGIFLTNAHVVADPDRQLLLGDPNAAFSRLEKPIRAEADKLAGELNADCPVEILPVVQAGLIDWFAKKSQATGKFKEARIVWKYGKTDKEIAENFTEYLERSSRNGRSFSDAIKGPPLTPDGGFVFHPDHPLTIPTTVIAKGEPMPGVDVAVLKADLGDDRYRIFCLPLGNSDSMFPGTPIHAIGFPVAAFLDLYMDPSARFKASSEPGEISQIKQVGSGSSSWDSFEMSALINHGDSGGPVIDRNGDVIAITVTVNQLAPGHNGAVPINLAQRYLKQAGVTPETGRLSQLLTESLQLLAAGKYGECRQKFLELENARVPLKGGWKPEHWICQLESLNSRLQGKPDEVYLPGTPLPKEDLETSKDSLDRFLKQPVAPPLPPQLILPNHGLPRTPPNLGKPLQFPSNKP